MFFIMCIIAVPLSAQNKTLTGRVVDSNSHDPVSFASVVVKDNNTLGVYTDDSGKFTLTGVPSSATHLIISFVGYNTIEIPIAGKVNFEVLLKPDAMVLDQVIVTALGIQRQSKEVGYSTAKVNSEDLTRAKNMDASKAMIGKVSGLQISTASASLDADVRINLRGSRSFKGNNQALLVVDGVPTPIEYLQSMNPNDIENISVLKGGSAAALYGSSAANGVLYVTTRSGERGRPRLTYSLTTTFDKMSYFPKYQTRFGAGAEDSNGFPYYIKAENQQYGPEFDGSEVPIGSEIMLADGTIKQLTDTYDFKEGSRESYYQTGIGLQNDVSFSSGGENGAFFLSYQHADKKGTIVGDHLVRQTVRLNASRKYKNIKVSANVSYSNMKSDINNSSSNGMQALWNTPANIDLRNYKDWRNVEGGSPDQWVNDYYLNPYAQIDIYRRQAQRDRVQLAGNIEYKPLKWLSFQGRAGLNLGFSNNNTIRNPWHYSAFAKSTSRSYAKNDVYTYLSTSSSYYNRLNLDAMAFANHDFNKKYAIKGMVGWSMGQTYSEAKNVGAEQMAIDGLFNVDNKVGELFGSNSKYQARNMSVYGSVDVKLFGWAYLQVTGRNDWSSLLSKENRSFFYPGANMSVMLSDAIPAIKSKDVISYLKLRATFAKVGTVNIGIYDLNDIANVHESFPFGNLTAYYVSQNIRDPQIKPEFTTEYEVGAEIGFWKDRVVFEAALYHQTTTNQTVNVSIPHSTGYVTKYVNAGTMTGKGVELDLKVTPLLEFGDFRWNVNANATFAQTKVTELYGGLDELTVYAPIYAVLGDNYPIIKATDYKRDPQGRVIINPNTGLPYLGDLANMGTTEPKVRIGLSTNLSWKGITLSSTFDYRGGHVVRFGQEYEMLFTGTSYTSALMGRERFVFPNSVVEVEDANGNVTYEPNTNITVNSGGKSFWVSNYRSCRTAQIVSGNAWKWRELSLTYEFPEKLLERTKFIQRLSCGFVANNLFMWLPDTNIWGDPENWSGSDGNSNAPGMSANTASGYRTFGFNLTISF